MKTLLVLRHAKSSWSKPGMADHDRPLNDRGKRDAPRMGRLLQSAGLVPDMIVCSTAKRAIRTAEKVAKHCAFPSHIDATSDFYLARADRYIEYVSLLGGDADRVMVVGHNPGVEDLVCALTGSFETMPTAALAQIDFDLDRWEDLRLDSPGQLVNLWRPKELQD